MKYLTLVTLVLVAGTAQADFWDNCTAYGGTIITANSYGNDKGGDCNDPSNPDLTNNCNGKRFCKIGQKINWWSAFTWCDSIGGKLASLESLCPGTQYFSFADCPNFKGTGQNYYWTSTGLGTRDAFTVSLAGSLGTNNRDANTASGTALCEEK